MNNYIESQFEKGLILGAFNPFHKGHEYLFKKAQKFCKLTDVYVGDGKRDHRLPRNIRAEAVKSAIGHNGWEDKFMVIEVGKHTDLDPNKYSLFVTGSDLLNIVSADISSRGKKIGDFYKNYYLTFPEILIINREKMPLRSEARDKLEGHIKLIEITGSTDISGSKIRQAYREGKDISGMVSENVWEIIKNNVHVFGD